MIYKISIYPPDNICKFLKHTFVYESICAGHFIFSNDLPNLLILNCFFYVLYFILFRYK